jgi:hypothetical protein
MWKCKKCGEKISDKFGACWKCNITKNGKPLKMLNEKNKKRSSLEESDKYKIGNSKLKCSFCGNDRFFTRESMLNTQFMTFIGWDWLNRTAENYICDKCGFIMWFLREI